VREGAHACHASARRIRWPQQRRHPTCAPVYHPYGPVALLPDEQRALCSPCQASRLVEARLGEDAIARRGVAAAHHFADTCVADADLNEAVCAGAKEGRGTRNDDAFVVGREDEAGGIRQARHRR